MEQSSSVMKNEDIHLSDWLRIIFGDLPPLFYIELIIRISFIFFILITAMRLMGKRMSAQLSRNEMAALVSLAAATGVPLQSPDRGLVPAMVIAAVVVLVQRWIASKTFADQTHEKSFQGDLSILISEGVMDRKTMLDVRMTRERLFAQARSQGIRHLGQVKRMYLEAGGSFSLIQQENPSPGLSVIPQWDIEMLERINRIENLGCSNCGLLKQIEKQKICTNCGSSEFERLYMT